jgi:transcriptional regulator with XRE-family HTH domain
VSGSDDVLRLVGQTIRELREERQLTQQALSELAGLDRTFVNGIENGQHSPTVVTLVRLAQALRVKPDLLFRRFNRSVMEKLTFD